MTGFTRLTRFTLLLAGAALTCTAPAALGAPAEQRPNIVLILADGLDQRISPFWERATAQGLDDPLKKTKALLVERGAEFTNAFAPTPICCPARATLLTGKYGHNTGVLTNGGDQGGWATFFRNGQEAQTIATYLQGQGYRTMLAGKYLNGIENEPAHIPAGWNEWYAFVDNVSYTGYNYGRAGRPPPQGGARLPAGRGGAAAARAASRPRSLAPLAARVRRSGSALPEARRGSHRAALRCASR